MEDFVSEYAQPRIRSIFLDPSERDAAHSKLSEWLKLLCMLDRDHLICKSRAVCGVCCSVHKTSLLSTTELQKDSTIRQCLGREGRLWVCPRTVLSYDDLSDFYCEFDRNRIPLCDGCDYRERLLSPGVSLARPLFEVPEGTSYSRDSIAKALERYNVHICPHMCLKDYAVRHRFRPGCESPPACKCTQCSTSSLNTCHFCKAAVTIAIDTFYGINRRMLTVYVWRGITWFQSPTDPQ